MKARNSAHYRSRHTFQAFHNVQWKKKKRNCFGLVTGTAEWLLFKCAGGAYVDFKIEKKSSRKNVSKKPYIRCWGPFSGAQIIWIWFKGSSISLEDWMAAAWSDWRDREPSPAYFERVCVCVCLEHPTQHDRLTACCCLANGGGRGRYLSRCIQVSLPFISAHKASK